MYIFVTKIVPQFSVFSSVIPHMFTNHPQDSEIQKTFIQIDREKYIYKYQYNIHYHISQEVFEF